MPTPNTSDQPAVPVDSPSGNGFPHVMSDAMPSLRAALQQLDRVRTDEDERVRVSLAGAAALALTSSIATAIYLRRRAQANARKLAWYEMAARQGMAMPYRRQIMPLGGAGASLVLLSLIVGRMRRARAQPADGPLMQRVANLRSLLDALEQTERRRG